METALLFMEMIALILARFEQSFFFFLFVFPWCVYKTDSIPQGQELAQYPFIRPRTSCIEYFIT